MMAFGRGITVCGFCKGRIDFRIDMHTVTIKGRDGEFSPLMPLYCSTECENARISHLFDEVLM